MITKYVLMHKNIPVIHCKFDDGYLCGLSGVENYEHIPIGAKNGFGKVDVKSFAFWWERRQVPKDRLNLKNIVGSLYNPGTNQLLANSFGLNLSDQYWLKPDTCEVNWEDVNFFENDFTKDLGEIYLDRADCLQYKGQAIGPDVATNGTRIKAWKKIGEDLCLLKKSGTFLQEAYNEVAGTKLCQSLGVPSVQYRVLVDETGVYSVCKCAVQKDEEIVSAYDLWLDGLCKETNAVKDFVTYRKLLKDRGLKRVDEQLDAMIAVDYILKNEDRHWSNFGIIRDANTLEWKRLMPVFDFDRALCSQTAIVDKRDIVGRLTGRFLYQDLLDVKCLSLDSLSKDADAVASFYVNSDILPISRRYELADVVTSRVDDILSLANKGVYYGVDKECV